VTEDFSCSLDPRIREDDVVFVIPVSTSSFLRRQESSVFSIPLDPRIREPPHQ